MEQTRDSITDVWGPRTPYREHWPVRVDGQTLEKLERWMPSVCLLCSYGCGIDIGIKQGRIVGIRGRDSDRTNQGRLRIGGLGLLRDLHDLRLAANEVHLGYEAVRQAAKALHDQPLVAACERSLSKTDRQIAWLRTRIDQAAPQTLAVG